MDKQAPNKREFEVTAAKTAQPLLRNVFRVTKVPSPEDAFYAQQALSPIK